MIRNILDTLMTTLSREDRNALVRAAGELGDVVSSNLDVRDRAKQAVAVLAGSGISASALKGMLDTTRERGSDALGAAGGYVRENPRAVGISAGTVAVAAVGAYAFYRLYRARPQEEDAILLEDHSDAAPAE